MSCGFIVVGVLVYGSPDDGRLGVKFVLRFWEMEPLGEIRWY